MTYSKILFVRTEKVCKTVKATLFYFYAIKGFSWGKYYRSLENSKKYTWLAKESFDISKFSKYHRDFLNISQIYR